MYETLDKKKARKKQKKEAEKAEKKQKKRKIIKHSVKICSIIINIYLKIII